MSSTSSYKGHSFSVTYATESDWPVTSVRLVLRRPLPAGVAIHPRGASPWSSGRISSRTASTGDAPFDKRFAVRAERPADLRFLGAEVRDALSSAIDTHPGLWLGNDGLVCVERGHIRDRARLEALLDELIALGLLVTAGEASTGGGRQGESGGRRGEPAAARAVVVESRDQIQAKAEAQAQAFQIESASREPGDLQAFIQACFDRRVAAYEVSRRLKHEWQGRRVHGVGKVIQRTALGGHDFEFADLKGFRVDLHVAGPEEIAPLVRVQLQLEETQREQVEAVGAGDAVRFDGQLQGANPLLFSLQIVSGSLSLAR